MTLRTSAFLAGLLAVAGAPQTLGAPMCRPTLAFKDVRFSPMRPPTMQRTWTAVVSVDASRCAADARGHFQIVFTRLQEFGPDGESSEDFTWAAPEVTVTLDFAPTEALERYRIGAVTPCPCADKNPSLSNATMPAGMLIPDSRRRTFSASPPRVALAK